VSRALVESWLRRGLKAVDPETLARQALSGREGPLTVIAIGKAAPAMCRGADTAVGEVSGLCISNHAAAVPNGVELIVGDHPIPGPNSLRAGRRALQMAPQADIALLSGGGSALCEVPAAGVTMRFLASVHKALVDGGASIEETNLVRAHLSRIKGGGLGPLPTYVLSDVSGLGPGVVASGPTIPCSPDPDRVLEIMRRHGVEAGNAIVEVVHRRGAPGPMPEIVEVIGDGRLAALGVAAAAKEAVVRSAVRNGWINGPLGSALQDFIAEAPPGVTVAAGEPDLDAHGGRGGRNSHAALLASNQIAGSDWMFAAFATDGVDGHSDAAGAIVDGTTRQRGGDATTALMHFDSAAYLETTGDLIRTGPTGTNVADLWLIWKPEERSEPILSS